MDGTHPRMSNFSSKVPHSFYQYDPSTAAAVVFAILYAVENIILLYQLIRYRAWAWTVFFVASISKLDLKSWIRGTSTSSFTASGSKADFIKVELLGYIARIVSIKNVDQQGIYVAQFALIVLAPILMAAAYYVIFVSTGFRLSPEAYALTKPVLICSLTTGSYHHSRPPQRTSHNQARLGTS